MSCWPRRPAGQAAGWRRPVRASVTCWSYLRAYYRHVPAEDLAAAGAGPVAAVAMEQARLAAPAAGPGPGPGRPGRLGGRVRPGRDGVDIVTDDMPFLVDSVTMELARHGVNSYRVVHPQLLVRRDVAGALREVLPGPLTAAGPAHDELPNPGRTSRSTLPGLRRAAGRAGNGPAPGAGRRPGLGRGLRADAGQGHLAGRPAVRRGSRARRRDRRPAALAGRQPLHVPRLPGVRPGGRPGGMALQAVPGTGLGILRHDRPGRSRSARCRPRCAPGPRSRTG